MIACNNNDTSRSAIHNNPTDHHPIYRRYRSKKVGLGGVNWFAFSGAFFSADII